LIGPVGSDVFAQPTQAKARPAQTGAQTSRVQVVIPTLGSRRAGTATKLSITYLGWKPAVDRTLYRRWRKAVARIAGRYQLEPALLHAVISVESSYDPIALSEDGAMGLMQLIPSTARRFQVDDPYEPTANLDGGARYLRYLLNLFDDLKLALAAYNAGENAVLRHGKAIPPYPETRRYVTKVLGYYAYFQTLPG
jgi:soluble lytic murein transglycosylase-like protein